MWVALHDPADPELYEMQREFGLHALAVEDARVGHQRPKIEEYGSSLFAVLHIIEPNQNALAVGELAYSPARIMFSMSANRRAGGFQEVLARCEREPDLLRQGSSFVLYALIDAVVDRYFPLLSQLESELESIEQRMCAPRNMPAMNIEALYGLKRRLTIMKHAVAPLVGGSVGPVGGARATDLRRHTRVFRRRERPSTTPEPDRRLHPRYGGDRDVRKLVDGHPARKRDDEAPGGLCGSLGGSNDDRESIRDEL